MIEVLIAIILLSTILLYVTEKISGQEWSWAESFWTVIYTIFSAADFADKHPVSIPGKVLVFILSLLGIGVVGFIIAELAGNFILKKLKEGMGMRSCDFKNHYILCGWNLRAKILVKELESQKKPLVVIAPSHPDITYSPAENFMWIDGDPADDTKLEQAGVDKAHTAIILADPSKTPDDADAKSILIVLNIEKKNSKVQTVIELLNPKNEAHAKRVNVDNIIFCDQILADVIASCALNEGLAVFLKDILSVSSKGWSFQIKDIEEKFWGKKVGDLFRMIREEKNDLPIALLEPPDDPLKKEAPPSDWNPKINPEPQYLIPAKAKVIVIGKDVA